MSNKDSKRDSDDKTREYTYLEDELQEEEEKLEDGKISEILELGGLPKTHTLNKYELEDEIEEIKQKIEAIKEDKEAQEARLEQLMKKDTQSSKDNFSRER